MIAKLALDAEALAVKLHRPVEVFLVGVDARHVVERGRLALPVGHLALEGEALLVQFEGGGEVVAVGVEGGDLMQRGGLALLIAESAPEFEALAVEVHGLIGIAEASVGVGQAVEDRRLALLVLDLADDHQALGVEVERLTILARGRVNPGGLVEFHDFLQSALIGFVVALHAPLLTPSTSVHPSHQGQGSASGRPYLRPGEKTCGAIAMGGRRRRGGILQASPIFRCQRSR